ncbi:MAG: hypothetical protein HC906_13230 [Bacteroidales bacterium]|nr:hypothetical protein [Bacteroidales bacterium]
MREKIILYLCPVFVIFGFITYIPSVIASVRANLWSIVIIDTAVYAVMVINCMLTKISNTIKSITILTVGFLLGVLLLVFIGPYGAGTIWLIFVPVIAVAMIGLKAAVVSILANVFVVIILAALIFFKIRIGLINAYSLDAWIAVGSNFIIISIVTTIPLAVIINGLNKSFFTVKKTKDVLEKKCS